MPRPRKADRDTIDGQLLLRRIDGDAPTGVVLPVDLTIRASP